MEAYGQWANTDALMVAGVLTGLASNRGLTCSDQREHGGLGYPSVSPAA